MFVLILYFVVKCRRRLHLNLKLFDPTKEPFYKRYFTGNVLLISVWLFFLPSLLDLIFPVWGYINELNSGITTTRYNYALVYVQLISSLVVVIFVIFFWVYATLPGNMRQNGGRGPYEFLYYLSVLGLLYLKLVRPLVSGSAQENSYQPLHQKTESFDTEYEPTSDTSFLNTVWRKCWDVFGSDYTVGVLIFALSSTAGLVISCIMAFDNSTDPEYIFGIVCSLVFTLGTYVLLYASHPRNMRKDNWAGSRDIHKLSMSLCGASEVDDDVNLLQ